MSAYAHRVLLKIRNPFIKHDKRYASEPKLVWLTRDEIAEGYGSPSPGTEYLLMFYRFDGTVKWHFKLQVRNKMHRREKQNAG